MSEYQRKRKQAQKAGTWQPHSKSYKHRTCSVPGCGRVARYLAPDLCNGHYQQALRGAPFTPLRQKNFVSNGTKQCTRCGIVKPLDEYNRRLQRQSAECKACWSILNRANRRGVSFDEMKALLQANKACATCGSDGDTRPLHVDHDHATGAIRGVLCHWCNTVLSERMTPEILRQMAAYLEGDTI